MMDSIGVVRSLLTFEPFMLPIGGAGKHHDWAIEFHNSILNHYFLTIDPAEADAIIAGAAGPGWEYTGKAIPAYATAASATAGTRSACRFYGDQAKGGPNGHFYTVDPDECAQAKKDPGWTFERNEFFVGVPQVAQCAAGMSPVYRVYNGRFAQNEPNHRYMTHCGMDDQMQASGWRGRRRCVLCGGNRIAVKRAAS